jgi:glycerol-3-phosphate acyltransferase PlsY
MPEAMNWSLAGPYFPRRARVGYLFGSTPFGVLLTRFAGLGDIRNVGSGNIGATNVLRTGPERSRGRDAPGGRPERHAAVLLMFWMWGPNTGIVAAIGAFSATFPRVVAVQGGQGRRHLIGCLIGLKLAAAGSSR